MQVHRMAIAGAVPAGIALIALLHARAVSALVEATISGSMMMPSAIEPRAGLVAGANPSGGARPSADAILDRNPFDHLTGSLRPPLPGPDHLPGEDLASDPRTAPLCDGVRPLVVVGNEDQSVAFASLDVGGKRLLRRRGGEVGDQRVAYVGRDRVWLVGRGGLCQAPLFGAPPPVPAAPTGPSGRGPVPAQTPLEAELGKQIAKTGPNEYAIERSAVDRILEAQAELMRSRIVQEKEGDRVAGVRVLGIKPGSVLSMLGIENNDRLETINGQDVSNTEKMMEVYARLKTGVTEKMQIHVTRGGKPLNLDYAIR
ncbi:MAG: ral secretion pathway protein [Labilithrix sp.]|nr:ral secretion pathway protein [Labilithrix sp.]